jgi:hypothetical protein
MRAHTAQAPVNYYALVWALIPIMTIVGNALVVLSVVRERALQSVTNYFIVSLAVSDFIVASVVMPFGVYTEVRINCFSTISEFNEYFCPLRAQILVAKILPPSAIDNLDMKSKAS